MDFPPALISQALPDAVLLPPVCCRETAPLHLTAALLAPAVNAVRAGESVTVVVSDHTRHTGAAELLPFLLDGWQARGVRLDDVRILIACGSHRGPTPDEVAHLLGPETASRCAGRIHTHSAFTSPCDSLATTRRGTPVEVNRLALAAGALVTIGGVVFHYFAGFTGGRKSVVPGLASARTIAANHSLSIDAAAGRFREGVEIGCLEGNPLAEDLEEAAAFVPVRASVQTVLDRQGRVAGVFAGELRSAHRAACEFAQTLFAFSLAEPADVVLAAAGSARNWVQSHKALVNASRAVRPGGVVVLVAPCPEGLGSESIRRWLALGSPAAIISGLAEAADINAQTALSTLLRGRRAVLVTEMSETDVALTGMHRAATLADAVVFARQRLPAERRCSPLVLPMPEAWLTVPFPPGAQVGIGPRVRVG